MSLASPNRIELEVEDLTTGIKTTYPSMAAVARALGTQPCSIRTTLNSKRNPGAPLRGAP
jgi:hypothetical protein